VTVTTFMLTREQVRSFYNRFGAKKDWQRFYEGPAIRDLLAHGAFERAQAVFELGCGTGALVENLLTCYLSRKATYLCFHISSTMVSLAKTRLNKYGPRVEIRLTNGSLKLPLPDSRFDRFISNYALDLLPPEDIEVVMYEAHRVLEMEGRLCLISLTYGNTLASQVVIWLWRRIFGFHPSLVGGCRPVKLLDFISEKMWEVIHHNLVVTFGIPSEVIVARKSPL
jgi:ubiquinone/menaquinone biosynthesis C-methylase UbiE